MLFKNIRAKYQNASLTVEAALVLPVFLYFILAFLYFIQIFTVQEKIQSSITKMGLNISKMSYVLQDFPDIDQALSFDFTVFDNEFDINPGNLVDSKISESALKLYAKKYLDTNLINHSCIKGGFDGISFDGSSILKDQDYIDIVVSYQIKLPVKIFIMNDMHMAQRIKLHKWTGFKVAATYQTVENKDDEIVYITDTGSVYHKDKNCSHIKLSVTAVTGIPSGMQNEEGVYYTPCEACNTGQEDPFATYYITSDGTKYHTRRDCSKIKRSVKEIKLSEVGSRTPCKRCCGGQ